MKVLVSQLCRRLSSDITRHKTAPCIPPKMTESVRGLRADRVFTLLAYGFVVLWAGLLLVVVSDSPFYDKVGLAVAVSAALFLALLSVAGSLGIPETSQQQNLGLLVLAAVLVLSSALLVVL